MTSRKKTHTTSPNLKAEAGMVHNFKKFIQGRTATRFNKADELVPGHRNHQIRGVLTIIYESDAQRLLYVSGTSHDWPFDVSALQQEGFNLVRPQDMVPDKLQEALRQLRPARPPVRDQRRPQTPDNDFEEEEDESATKTPDIAQGSPSFLERRKMAARPHPSISRLSRPLSRSTEHLVAPPNSALRGNNDLELRDNSDGDIIGGIERGGRKRPRLGDTEDVDFGSPLHRSGSGSLNAKSIASTGGLARIPSQQWERPEIPAFDVASPLEQFQFKHGRM